MVWKIAGTCSNEICIRQGFPALKKSKIITGYTFFLGDATEKSKRQGSVEWISHWKNWTLSKWEPKK